ncbi:cerebellar degeneration-related protein 2 [Amblyraja radiata]|uniref:cerebellar degeneration-related protein 2 n=1 Tax=Amblyraja radiata TaxID=386614 RepID=UPI0014033DC6|nr:cerebellar degeneration-related protein 2 [Amblyraja radiata]
MLTDRILEEFERREDPRFQQRRDMEHDLQLAAELGKALLDRNTELEEALQQMYSTNQEQIQEIEYLTKQVEFLRQMNEQHTKVYEQLDVSARELEMTNQKLVLEGKASENKIASLTETVDSLQSQVDDLQQQMEELKTRSRQELLEQRRLAQSFPCLTELYDSHTSQSQVHALEEEGSRLRRCVSGLRAQLCTERRRAEGLEQERLQVLRECGGLQRGVATMHHYCQRLGELEASVGELRRRSRELHGGAALLLWVEGEGETEEVEGESPVEEAEAEGKSGGDEGDGHELSCARRTEAVRRRGVSLLNEVDAQYGALQHKYDRLLQRCQRPGHPSSHKAVQTPGEAQTEPSCEGGQPEYKALFQQIFSCIQRTKEEISEGRSRYRAVCWRHARVEQQQQQQLQLEE